MPIMKRGLQGLAAGSAALLGLGLAARLPSITAAEKRKPIRLFNGKNFDGWYTYVQGDGKNRDPDGIFKIEAGGIIHASGKKFGYVGTVRDYENYKLTLEFKWGERKWPPRVNEPRDAGILYHCVGSDKVWMKSLECQIQERDCGDMWLTGDQSGVPSLTVKGKRYTGGRVVKSADFEKPHGQWNKIEVVCRGNQIQHYVNGRLNLEGTNASLTKGRINLQSEGAEIYYRNINLQPLE
jgi:hypothetical protein